MHFCSQNGYRRIQVDVLFLHCQGANKLYMTAMEDHQLKFRFARRFQHWLNRKRGSAQYATAIKDRQRLRSRIANLNSDSLQPFKIGFQNRLSNFSFLPCQAPDDCQMIVFWKHNSTQHNDSLYGELVLPASLLLLGRCKRAPFTWL